MTVSTDRSASPVAALSSALPREYVHKSAHSEVLLTGWRAVAPDEFVVTAQWPRTHSFYTPDEGHHDPLLLAETVRQAIPLLSHVAYDVPFGHRQIWDTFRYATDPDALAVGSTPADISLHIRCSGISRRGRRLAALTMHVTATRDGAFLGTAEAGFTNQPEAVYQRLRGRNADLAEVAARTIPLPPPLTPAVWAATASTTWSSPPPAPRGAPSSGPTSTIRSSSTTPSTTPRACCSWRPFARPRTDPPSPGGES